MKTRTILVALLAVAALYATPSTTEASAVLINDTTALITIDFGFKASAGDYEIPVAASSTVTYASRADVVGYEIAGADILGSSALVLSRAQLTGVRYGIEEDDTAIFTLFIIATLREPATDDLTATITKIPYWINAKRTTVHQNQLDELMQTTIKAS